MMVLFDLFCFMIVVLDMVLIHDSSVLHHDSRC